jgi:cystathionine beta-lyase
MSDKIRYRPRTRMVHSGRPGRDSGGAAAAAMPVNPPVERTSTVLFESMAAMREVHARRASGERLLSYGRRGTSTAFALEDAITDMENGYRTRLFPSGLAAIAATFLAFLRPGDHVAIADSVYEPVRRAVCVDVLEPYGIHYSFFAADASDLEAQLRPSTRLIYAECPGSLVFEMVDLRRVAKVARARGIIVAADNTWGSGYLYHPLELGADVSVIAATKYIVGHSDVMLGAVVTNEAAWHPLARTAYGLGHVVSPDDAYLALRGLRSMAARLVMHQQHAMQVIEWIKTRPEIRRVFYPALPEHPGHELWKRDFSGACGLFSIEFRPEVVAGIAHERGTDLQSPIDRFVDALKLFGLGASWGGFESLVLPENVAATRTVADWSKAGPVIRFHVGLEDPDDLVDDLAQAMERFYGG